MKTQFSEALPENMNLPLDLWQAIFQKLPVKTLLRFRTVCKSWCTIIDSPVFITEHHLAFNDSFENRSLLIDAIREEDYDRKIRVVDSTFDEMVEFTVGRDCHVYESLNGLILLDENARNRGMDPNLRLYNPFLRKSLYLLPCPKTVLPTTMFVLGFDLSAKGYKVIGFSTDTSSKSKLSSEIIVYSCIDHSWKTKHIELGDTVIYGDIISRKPQLCKGSAHWLVRAVNRLNEYTRVLSFDFGREDFRCVQLPLESWQMCKFLFVSLNSLAVFSFTGDRTDVWKLREVPQNCWELYDTKTSKLDSFTFTELEHFGKSARVAYDDKSGKLFYMRFEFPNAKLISYQINSQQMKTCGTTTGLMSFADTHAESLIDPLKL